jgi:hypothetical protein
MLMTYGKAVNAEEMSDRRYLPEGLSRDATSVGTSHAMRCSPTTSICPQTGSPTGSVPSNIGASSVRLGLRNGYRS